LAQREAGILHGIYGNYFINNEELLYKLSVMSHKKNVIVYGAIPEVNDGSEESIVIKFIKPKKSTCLTCLDSDDDAEDATNYQ
jgi:hypothetical protein